MRIYAKPAIFLLFLSLTGCNEQQNPLLGQWKEISASTGNSGNIIEFTPSTMRINNQTVTVSYQIRKDKVRVSASKNAIIYEFSNANEIHFEDKKRGTVRLKKFVRH